MGQGYDLCFFDDRGELVIVDLGRFRKPGVTIGRDAASADIVLEFEKISRIHGRFLLMQDGLYYQDDDSLNGTMIVDNMRNRLYFVSGRMIHIFCFLSEKHRRTEDGKRSC